jgi:ABC-type polysaccharide/polyol phosphate export permease
MDSLMHETDHYTAPLGRMTDTLLALVGREFRIRYKGSFFGLLWAVLSPLGTVAILQFVFGRVMSVSVPHFEAFIYSGLLPWIWFSAAVQTGATTLVENRDLVRTPFFVKPLLPGVVTCTNFILYLAALPVLLFLLVADGIPVTRAVLALPAVWLCQAVLTLGTTVLIAAIGVLVRDVQHLMGVVLLFWFYLTPIFYDLDQVPRESMRWFSLNPMTPIISAHRAVTLYGRYPSWSELALWTLIGFVVLFVSLRIFRALEDAFVEEA